VDAKFSNSGDIRRRKLRSKNGDKYCPACVKVDEAEARRSYQQKASKQDAKRSKYVSKIVSEKINLTDLSVKIVHISVKKLL